MSQEYPSLYVLYSLVVFVSAGTVFVDVVLRICSNYLSRDNRLQLRRLTKGTRFLWLLRQYNNDYTKECQAI